jgi:uncharacterized protein (TIGR01244 family)
MNQPTRAAALCGLVAGLALGCAKKAPSEPEHQAITTERLEPYECGTIARLHTYGGVFLASQPSPEDFAQAQKGGVRTVVNLRHADEVTDFDERAVVTDLGLEYVSLPWNGADELTDEVFDRARQVLDTAERPILLHCGSANRVGAVWIPWRVLDGGLSYDEALAEAKTIGLKTSAFEAKAKDYVERHGG